MTRAHPARRAARGALSGLAAGACGTAALNAATYLDMTVRGRPASSTPEQMVDRVCDALHVAVPGDGETRENRRSGLGALSGIVAGVTAGALVGAVRGLGWRPGPVVSFGVTALVAMLAGNAPMSAAGVSDPRTWNASEWLADLAPHAAYAAAASTVLRALDR